MESKFTSPQHLETTPKFGWSNQLNSTSQRNDSSGPDLRQDTKGETQSRWRHKTSAKSEKKKWTAETCWVKDKWILRSILGTSTFVEQPQELHREWGQRRQFLTVPPENISEPILQARKIEFESCK